MPELPETETIARDLDAALRGAVISGFAALRPDVLREVDAAGMAAAVTGATIVRSWRRAKLVVLDLDGADGRAWHVVVQPRFTGGLFVAPPTDYVALTWSLRDGRTLHYRDVRRLGTVALMDATRLATYTAALGPEPLDDALTPETFSVFLRSSRRAIKVVLMDQRRLAGVGNIYANEALWHARIDPSRPARSLSPPEVSALLDALRSVLRASIALRGTSFRDYRDAHGGRGGFVARLEAYGRGGAPCRRCDRPLVDTHSLDGRSTVFCAGCQR